MDYGRFELRKQNCQKRGERERAGNGGLVQPMQDRKQDRESLRQPRAQSRQQTHQSKRNHESRAGRCPVTSFYFFEFLLGHQATVSRSLVLFPRYRLGTASIGRWNEHHK